MRATRVLLVDVPGRPRSALAGLLAGLHGVILVDAHAWVPKDRAAGELPVRLGG